MKLRGVNLFQLMRTKQLHNRIEQGSEVIGEYPCPKGVCVPPSRSQERISKADVERHAMIFDVF
jgi:hypothetical protein